MFEVFEMMSPIPRIHRTVLRWCLALIELFSDAQSFAQEVDPAGTTFDLSCPRMIDRPMLIRVQRVTRATATAHQGFGSVATKEQKDDFVYVDRVRTLDEDKVTAEFVVVQADRTLNGNINDPTTHGARLDYTFTFHEPNVSVTLQGGRRVAAKDLDELVAMSPGFSLSLALPEDASANTVVPIDLSALVRMMLGTASPLETKPTEMTVTGFDVRTGIAKLNGASVVIERRTSATATYAFDIELEIDTRQHFVSRSVGTAKSDVDGELLSGTGEHRFEITTQIGKPAAAALARKTIFRNTLRPNASTKISLELPSHWIDIPTKGGSLMLQRGIDAEVFTATIELKKEDVNVDAKTEKEFFNDMADEFKKLSLKVTRSTDVSAGGMKGKSFDLLRDNQRIVSVVLIGKDAIYIVRLECPNAEYSTVKKEFEDARSSIKVLAK